MTDIAKSSPRFSYPSTTLQKIAQDVLSQAKKLGATACETDISDGFGQNVTVRRGEVETIEYNRDKGLSVTRLHRAEARPCEYFRFFAPGGERHSRGSYLDSRAYCG